MPLSILDHFRHPARLGEILGAGGGGGEVGKAARGLCLGGTCPPVASSGWRWEGKDISEKNRKGSHEPTFLPSLSREWNEMGLGTSWQGDGS